MNRLPVSCVERRPSTPQAAWALAAPLRAAAEAPPRRPRRAPVPTPTAAAPRPNFVLVVTDDLDVPTALEMPRLPDLMADRGLSFTRAYVAQSLCAPSRASILTGQYTHNHGVTGNEPPDQGFVAFRRHEAASLAPWLKAAGYRTALVGKYIERLPVRGGRSLRAPRLGRLVRAPDRDRGRSLLRLLGERQRQRRALRLEAAGLQRRRRDEARGRSSSVTRPAAPSRSSCWLGAAGAPRARHLHRAARRRVPLLAGPSGALLQRGRRQPPSRPGCVRSRT